MWRQARLLAHPRRQAAPAGATTNSASGVTSVDAVMPTTLEKMAEIGLPLCVHGEVTTHGVDIFDREKVFIDTVLDLPAADGCQSCA